MSPMFPQVLESTFRTDPWSSWADPEGGRGSGPPPPPEKSQKIRVSKQYWSRSPEKSQSYKASIQCWAIIGPPASDITFWECAWLYFRVVFSKRYISVFSISTPVTLRMQKALSRFLLHNFP